MCNSYSLTKGQAAIIALVRAMRDHTGNLPPMPGIFPDFLAPIARTAMTACPRRFLRSAFGAKQTSEDFGP